MAVNEQRFRKEGIYEARSPLPSLLRDLDQINGILSTIQLYKRKVRNIGVLCLPAAATALALGVVLDLVLLIVMGILLGIGAIAIFIYAWRFSRRIIQHRSRLYIARKRVDTLRQDAGEHATFSLRLALDGTPKLLSEQPWPRRKKGKEQFFEDSWLYLEGPLLDGAILIDEVKELSRKRTYLNPRGKRKTKTRTRQLVTLRFNYPKDLYGDARLAHNGLHEEIRVSPATMLRGVRVTEKAVSLKAVVLLEDEIAQACSMLSMGAYRILNLSRRVAAAGRGHAQ